MQCSMCGGAELVHDMRVISYTYKGESTLIPRVTGDCCPACGDRYSALIAQFHHDVRERLGISGPPEPMLCLTCGGAELVHATRDIPYTYQGETTTIQAVTGEHCDACGEAITGRAEGNRIMQAMRAFAEQVDARQRNSDAR